MTLEDDAINLHRLLKGKIEIQSRISVENVFDEGFGHDGGKEKNSLDEKEINVKGTLGLIYTPGVAYVAESIGKNKELAYDYTSKWNNVAIVCDGTRVLGLGNIGPEAAIPVMEGKSILFKMLGGINAYPLCISSHDKEDIISFIKMIQPVFGAINVEDIESPKVLEIVERLQKELPIPVFHDDQHGTAVITLAALINALRLLNKRLEEARIVVAGAGSAGYGIFKILLHAGCRDFIVTDSHGAIYQGRDSDMKYENRQEETTKLERNGYRDKDISTTGTRYKLEIAKKTNPSRLSGRLEEVIRGADVFIGVSGKGNLLTQQMVRSMNHDAIVFALSNPDPEILPPDALQAGARIVATGRSDFANQVNNALVFPSVLRALLDTRARLLDEEMLVAVGCAIASLVEDTQLREDSIIPKVNDARILPVVIRTIKEAIQKHMETKLS